MIARDEHRQRVVEVLAAHLLRTGLAEASLRQLAAAAGVSDRMLLYYFDDKADVLSAAMQRVATDFAASLAAAVPETELPARQIVAKAAALVLAEATRPYMRLWVEVVAAAARGEAPFPEIAAQIVAGFMGWIDSRLAPRDLPDRQAVTAAILAVIDGMALLEITAGADLTARAAKALVEILDAGPAR